MVSFSVLQMTREAANEAFACADYPQLIVRRQERNYVFSIFSINTSELCGFCAKLLFTCVTEFWNRQRFQNWCDSNVELGPLSNLRRTLFLSTCSTLISKIPSFTIEGKTMPVLWWLEHGRNTQRGQLHGTKIGRRRIRLANVAGQSPQSPQRPNYIGQPGEDQWAHSIQ
jgi:hypothetical protein